ncbi:sensor histidine kinase [Candidatus Margulisiibacteriota bacterium]
MSNNLPHLLPLSDVFTTHKDQVLDVWKQTIRKNKELNNAVKGPPRLSLDEMMDQALDVLNKITIKKDHSYLNRYLAWLLAERQRVQVPPDIISRIIILLQEAVRGHLKEEDFPALEDSVSLVSWGFIQRYFNGIVQELMTTNEKLDSLNSELEQRVADRTRELEFSTQKIKDWNKALELNIQDRTRDLLVEQKKLSTIIENIAEGILVTDFDNKITQINHNAKKILGIKQKHVINEHILNFVQSPSFLKIISDALDHGPGNAIVRDLDSLNSTRPNQVIRAYTTLAINKNREPMGVISVLRDITAERELETAKASFLNTAAHELRTPLTSIMGFLNLLLEPGMGELDSTQKDFLKSAHKSGLDLKNLINGLLELSRIDAGKVQLKYEEINLNNLMDQIVQEFRPKAKANDLQFKLAKPGSPNIIIQANQARLLQIINNLCDNALKFTTKGSVSLSYKQAGDHVEIKVKDTGIGIAKKDLPFIFNRFSQVDNSSTRAYEGTGLGLALIKELVELHNGSIRVESQYHQGSTFIITLPMAPLPPV